MSEWSLAPKLDEIKLGLKLWNKIVGLGSYKNLKLILEIES